MGVQCAIAWDWITISIRHSRSISGAPENPFISQDTSDAAHFVNPESLHLK